MWDKENWIKLKSDIWLHTRELKIILKNVHLLQKASRTLRGTNSKMRFHYYYIFFFFTSSLHKIFFYFGEKYLFLFDIYCLIWLFKVNGTSSYCFPHTSTFTTYYWNGIEIKKKKKKRIQANNVLNYLLEWFLFLYSFSFSWFPRNFFSDTTNFVYGTHLVFIFWSG